MKGIDILQHDWRRENPPSITIYDSKVVFFALIAVRFLELIISRQKTGDYFSVILGGGRTPKLLNQIIVELAKTEVHTIDWNRVFIYFSDERCVPPDHPDSNFKLIFDTLIKPLGISPTNVFRILGEIGPEKAAADYHHKLSMFSGQHDIPVFDLALLGLGADGHTASLFPHSPALKEFKNFAASAGRGPEGWERVTVTIPVFNDAKSVWMMASGAEKAPAVQQLIQGNYDPIQLPAQAVRPGKGELVYWLDSSIANIVGISEKSR
jgi:6-phosphogluconolactonase